MHGGFKHGVRDDCLAKKFSRPALRRKTFGPQKSTKAQERQNTSHLFFAPFAPFCGHSSLGIFILRGARKRA
jgi:hypothetical protein